jgi:hypothetical protein
MKMKTTLLIFNFNFILLALCLPGIVNAAPEKRIAPDMEENLSSR